MLGTEITLAGQSDTHTQLSGHGMLQGRKDKCTVHGQRSTRSLVISMAGKGQSGAQRSGEVPHTFAPPSHKADIYAYLSP